MARVLVTGASGFLGARVCRALEARGHRVLGLQRQPSTDPRVVEGNLLDPATYESRLAGIDAVVHLAAVTGKAPPGEYFRVNVEGTRTLVDAMKRAGVERLLFCSSIAVTFPDIRRYYYAQSKAEAERLVAHSGLRFTTIRPTIIAGEGSPVISKLESLASLPVVPLFGSGQTKVQPIDVSDLAQQIVAIVEADRFNGETLELGGPELVTLRELLDRLHRRRHRRAAWFLPLPLGLIVPALSLLERVAYGALPLTVGQLATFRFDGVSRAVPAPPRPGPAGGMSSS
jgi:nucleoside-diphosphate-sugar epimerase